MIPVVCRVLPGVVLGPDRTGSVRVGPRAGHKKGPGVGPGVHSIGWLQVGPAPGLLTDQVHCRFIVWRIGVISHHNLRIAFASIVVD